ncbi:hypothetical protein [Medusavirus stheno T3]|uniref:Uncharacterized protein n=1 Tax=Medusavirus stheno T3 TaxID=3069717 RepID=A0A7S8BEH7_9VIRU|nr:hypothetical protein QKU73_gp106 [Acanthamoeba castellanii medusavirus]QPB44287.1 hypothetical protein [Medusavirus stheno T3]
MSLTTQRYLRCRTTFFGETPCSGDYYKPPAALSIALVKQMCYRCHRCGGDLWMLPEGVLAVAPQPSQTVELPFLQSVAAPQRKGMSLTVHVDGLSTRAIIRADPTGTETVAERVAMLLDGSELKYHSSITRRDFVALLSRQQPAAQYLLDNIPPTAKDDPISLGEIVRYESVMLYLQTTEVVARCYMEGRPQVACYLAVLWYNKEKGRYEYANMHHDGGLLCLVVCRAE